MENYGYIKVAAAIPELKVADCRFNVEKIKDLLLQAVENKVRVVCFPELCITGYTCGDLFFQNLLLQEAESVISGLLRDTKNLPVAYIIGAPVKINNRLYNTALICSQGKILGIVPKSSLPNYSEFYEKRWFHPGEKELLQKVTYAGCNTDFGVKLLFTDGEASFGVEICEDLWRVVPISSGHAMAGAQIIFNLSASNELAGKNAYLHSLIAQQSARCIAGYIYVSAGWGESTTDLVFGGNGIVYENGDLLVQSERFETKNQLIISEIDIERLDGDRLRINTFRENEVPEEYMRIALDLPRPESPVSLSRTINPFPFIPLEEVYDGWCREIFTIQILGLAKRVLHTAVNTVVIGVSGGLDSTLALLVCAKTFDKIGLSRDRIVGVTMPGFGTTGRTYNNAVLLMQSLGITIREVNIKPACEQHFKDIGHDPGVHDVTFENSQARERTQILMDIANQMNGLVVGTGDMSELALGWATYNGDHMSMYAVNSGIPKTLVRHLVSWVSETQMDDQTSVLLKDILDTPVSPELVPAKNGTISQCTEEIVGPYELHDFFLYFMVRYGFSPEKIHFLSLQAFRDKYPEETILRWMEVFYKRFFSQQFKRSCIPDGPKVGSVNLSPRGDWRMPSDASAAAWKAYFQK